MPGSRSSRRASAPLFRAALPIPGGSNGKTLWMVAQWYNERGELGPASTAIAN